MNQKQMALRHPIQQSNAYPRQQIPPTFPHSRVSDPETATSLDDT